MLNLLYFFNLTLGKVIRESQIETIGTVLIQVPRYVLTQMIFTDALKETIKRFVKVAGVVRFKIKQQKTYYMEVTKNVLILKS
jgi:transcription antitermination factor NusG